MLSPDSSDTVTPFVALLGAREPDAGLEGDPALAERALQRLRARLVLGGHQARQAPRRSVTSAPNERQTLANSTPITPPPRTTTLSGTRSSPRACSLVMIRPPISRPGSVRAYEPVARTTLRPV